MKIKILAIETSCDETAAAVIGTEELKNSRTKEQKPVILSNIVSSQIDLHAKTGGVVPEVASRAHMESILPVIEEALVAAKKTNNEKLKTKNCERNLDKQNVQDLLSDITHVAVTAGPGLIGSLLVGFNTAKALAYSLDLPIIPINHIEGHVYSALPNTVKSRKLKVESNSLFPIVALTVSGGHTSLTLVKDHGEYENLGSTLDDAAGEAFDKVAKLLDLGYPGGPVVSKLANEFRVKSRKLKVKSNGIIFPRPILNDGTFNFSFSGLKTAVLTKVKNLRTEELKNKKEEICAAFEDAAVDVLTTKAMRAVEKYKPKGMVLAGGVAANRRLQEELIRKVDEYNEKSDKKDIINLYIPPRDMTGDNAAMIGLAAFFHISKGNVKKWNEIEVDSNMKL